MEEKECDMAFSDKKATEEYRASNLRQPNLV